MRSRPTFANIDIKTMLLEQTLVYKAWQAPFAKKKLLPVLRNNELSKVRRVLDVGCGPGTNTVFFAKNDYIGVDINEKYIRYARERHGRELIVADVRNYDPSANGKFDFVLANSFLHHLPTEDVLGILSRLSALLSEDGHIHILELVMPEGNSIARRLAQWDRGKFARPLAEWRRLFHESFEEVTFEPYPLKAAGTTLWSMVYFKGKRRS